MTLSDAVFLWLMTYAAKTTAVLATAWVATRLLRCASAGRRHVCWLVAIAIVAVMPFATAVVPATAVPSRWFPFGGAGDRAVDASPAPIARELPTSTSARNIRPTQRSLDELDDGRASHLRWSQILLLAWMSGFVFLMIRVLRDSVLARRIVRGAHTVSLPIIDQTLVELLGTGAARVITRTAPIESPLVAGIARPAIILPNGVAAWSGEMLRSVLAHEASHIAQRDCLTQSIARVMCAVHWFNPLAWVAARGLSTEAERACDDSVLRNGACAAAYAHVLLHFARASRGAVGVSTVVQMARQGGDLTARVESLLNPASSRDRPSRIERVALGITSFAVLMPLSSLRVSPMATASDAGPRVVVLRPTQRSAEPDQLGDSVASPESERLSLPNGTWQAARENVARTLNGPDALLAARLAAALDHVPTAPWDLVAERSAWSLALARGQRIVDPMLDKLSARDWRERAYAAWVLGSSSSARAVEPLELLLTDRIWRVRAASAAALARLGDQRARGAMMAALTDPAWQVRAEAVRLVGQAPDAEARTAVSARLADPHVAVRRAAEEVLAGK